MARFYIDKESIRDGMAAITGSDVRHLKDTLRIRKGDELTLCDGAGTVYSAVVYAVGEEAVTCEISGTCGDDSEPDIAVTLVQAVPKGDKMDGIIQKCVELGVSRIIPVYTRYTVVKPDSKGDANKVKRWNRIALEAAKQCGRGAVPEVEPPVHIKDALELSDGQIGIMAWEKECGDPGEVLPQLHGRDVRLLIGSEGGFSDEEAEMAAKAGYVRITMGPRILRSETAGPALLAAIMYATGHWRRKDGITQ